jgi:tetratricopeptide (TPR) repeat protein
MRLAAAAVAVAGAFVARPASAADVEASGADRSALRAESPSAQSGDTPPDAAQEARQQYQAGMQAYKDKRFVEAALHFEAAVVQRPHAVALYTAALAWEQANRPERAADDFARAIDVPGLSQAQAQAARDHLANLERAMGTLEVTGPEGWRVQLDANTGVLVPGHLHAMPGVHSLAIQPPSGGIQHRDVTLELAKTSRLALTGETAPAPANAPPPPAPVPAPPPRAVRTQAATLDLRHAAGFSAAGAGVAFVVAGVVLGESALSARDAYNASPTQVAYDHASSMQTWTDVAFIAGGVLVAGGAALILWPSPKKSGEPSVSLAPAAGGAILRGAF